MLNFDKIYAKLTIFCHFVKAFFAKQFSNISCFVKTFNSWCYQDHINTILYLDGDNLFFCCAGSRENYFELVVPQNNNDSLKF